MKKVLLWLGAFIFLTLGVFVTLLSLIAFFGGFPSKNTLQTDLALFVFLGLVPIAGGIWCILLFRKHAHKEFYDAMQLKVLKLAKEKQGTVGLSELSVALNHPLKQMEGVMDYLVKYGFAQMNVSGEGHISYDFLDFKK